VDKFVRDHSNSSKGQKSVRHKITLHDGRFFFSIVLGGKCAFFVYILLCRPSEDSLQLSTISDGSQSEDWLSTVGWEIARFEPGTAGLNLVLLPMMVLDPEV
jgi:hypothetical protein